MRMPHFRWVDEYISRLSRAVVSDPNNDGRIIVSLGSNAVPWNRFESRARPWQSSYGSIL
jgi:hypothetical protein